MIVVYFSNLNLRSEIELKQNWKNRIVSLMSSFLNRADISSYSNTCGLNVGHLCVSRLLIFVFPSINIC